MERFFKNIKGSLFWRRTLAVLLSLAVLVTLAPSNTYLVFPDDTTQSILGNTGVDLSAVTLKACYYDENGNWVEVTLTQDGDFTTIPYNATIEMTLDFTMVDGNSLEVGTEYVYELPDTIRVDENGVTHELAYQTTDGQEVSIGKVTIYSDGTLHFVFNDNITGQTNIPFYVKFDGELSDDLQESDQNATISFPTASGSYDFNITTTDAVDEDVDKTPADIGMSKSGSVVTVNGQKYILWTVTLSANGRDSLTGTITDNLPDGITYADVDGYPKISSNWSSYTEMSDVEITDGSTSVSIPLDGVTGSTVSVQFLTYYDSSIFGDTVSNSTVSIENTASFDSEDTEDTDPEASTTVWVTPNMVSKSGTLNSDGTITWTVTINAEQFDIGGTTYTDTFGSGITLTGDISVSSSDGTTDFTSYVATTGSPSATGFTITFPSGYSGTATVTYTTTISDYSQISYTNTGELKGTGYDYSTTAYVNGLDLLSKTSVSYNSLTREFTWNIYVDNAGLDMSNVVVTDTLKTIYTSDGDTVAMQFVSAEITSGSDYTGFTIDSADWSSGTYTGSDAQSVIFKFASLSGPVVITVVTKMTDEFYEKYLNGTYTFINSVSLTSDKVTTALTDYASRWVAVTAPVLIESKTGTINSDGTIDWTVVVKAQDAEYIPESYTLSDILPDDNEYVDGSLYVQNRYWDSDPISSADGEITVTCTKPDASSNYVLSATIDKTLCDTYGKTWLTDGDAFEIHYQTKVTDYETAVASTSYTNTATIQASYPDIDDVEDTEVCTVTGIAGGVLDKTYSYKTGSSTVTWTITINEAGNDMSDINNPRIVDELEDYFDYVPNSGVLYKVTDSGNVEVSEDDYEISAVNGTIIVWLPNIGTDTYVFVFQTAFNVRAEALQGTSVTNTVSFYGDGEIATEESEEITNINFSSSSAGSYLKQEFRIQKVDSVTNEPLEGATFYLYRNGEIVASATTDSDGWAVFDNMDFGATYSVIEYQAPDGYEKTDGSVTFDFKNDSSLTIVEESSVSRYYQYIWEDTAVSTSSATIRATKVDSESGEVITDGVTFGLYSDSSCMDDYLIESRTTVNGVVSFSGITDAGTYYLKELSAPAGYTLSDEVVKVVVASDGNNPPTYTVTYYSGVGSNTSVTVDSDTGYLYKDTKATGTLSITKVDADDNDTKIADVTFELYTDALARDCIDSQTTDVDGVATFTGLELGKTYYYREVSVPDTYVKDDTIYSITIGTGSETEDQTASVVVENEAALGDIVVTKVDDSVTPNAISGVTFTLQVWDADSNGGEYVDYQVASDTDPYTQVTYTVTTDDDGVARFENLPFGTYRVVETIPSGYSADSPYTEITVSSTGDTNVQIVNEVIRFNLKVVKTDDSDTPLANVGFTLYTASGIPVYTDVRTDEYGIIEFTGLKYGSYYLHETYTPAGYTAAEDVWITLTDVDDAVTTAGTNGTPEVTKTIENEKQNGALLAKKQDGTGSALAGAVFTLYDENNKVVATATSLAADDVASANSSLEDIWTNSPNSITLSEGDIWFSGLSFGTYYLVETSAPSGYQVNTGRYKVEITESGTVVKTGIDVNKSSATEAELTITDTTSTPPYISFKLKKTDEDGTPLSGAIFYLYQDDDRETPVAIATTDDNGIAYFRMINTSTNSITSYYSIVEVYAPYGYETSDTVLYISQSNFNIYTDEAGSPLSDGAIQYVGQSEAAATVTNEQILGEIQITKYGTTRLETLSGAVFTLYKVVDGSDDEVVGTATTNASGIATFSNLPVGSYYVKETTAPAGYTLSSQIVNIEVTDDTTYTASYLDTRLQLSVSKQSVTQSGEIAGAVLTLYRLDEGGNRVATVDSWTSTTSVHKVTYSKLQTGVTYELVETTAPAGYGYSDPVKFRIQTDGSIVPVDGTNAETSNPNGTTIVMKDTPITLSVEKQDENDDDLSNAILAIYDSNGTELTRFTTGSSAKVIDTSIFNAPATSGSYTYYSLKELSAPSGYALASDVEFAIGYDGSVYEVTNGIVGSQITSAVITMKDTEKPDTSIYILKVDGGTGIDLAGSKFQLLDDKGVQIDVNLDGDITDADTLVSNGTAIEITNIDKLLDKTSNNQFTLREIEAPTGYDLAADLYFTVALNGSKYEITVSYADRDTLNAAKDTLTIADDELHVYIRKQDGFGTLLAGAELILYEKTDAGGKTQVGDALITSNTEVISIESSLLKVNTTYILHESNSPAGYGLADDIEFTIQSDGSITRTDGTTVYNDTIIMQDDESDVTIHKVIEGTSEVLTGVTLQLTSEDDIYFTTMEWTSTDDIKVWEIAFTELTVGCSYTLSETQAPAGYTYADPITFTVGDDRQIYVDGVAVNLRDIVMEDCPIELYISKQDMTSREELSGAVLRLSDEAGNLIYEFTSGDTKTLIPAEKLVAAKEGEYVIYTLTETLAPYGYEQAETITFALDSKGIAYLVTERDDGSVDYEQLGNTVTMLDEPMLSIVKQDEEGNVVTGASLMITAEDDESFTPIEFVSERDLTYFSWDTFQVGKTYRITETEVPQGYLCADDILFRIDEDHNIYIDGASKPLSGKSIVVTDQAITVAVVKRDAENSAELAGATLTIQDKSGTVLYTFVSGTSQVTLPNTLFTAPEEGTFSYYSLSEVTAPDGYDIAETIHFAVNQDGQIFVLSEDSIYEPLEDHTIIMYDKRTGGSDIHPKTGDTVPLYLVGLNALLSLFAACLLLYRYLFGRKR